MATVILHAVVSVDGFIADDNDDVGPLFDWYFNGDRPIFDEAAEERHAPFQVGERSLEYVRPFWGSIGATVQGRHLFDLTNGWEADPPAGDHLVVVSHRPATGRRPGAPPALPGPPLKARGVAACQHEVALEA
jgi:hypothetical protein